MREEATEQQPLRHDAGMSTSGPQVPFDVEPDGLSKEDQNLMRFWEIATGVVGTAMFLAGVWVALGGRGPQFDRQEEAVGGVIFALGGLLCMAGSLKFRTMRTPLRRPVAGVAVRTQEQAHLGGTVNAELTVTPPASGADLEMGLLCVHRFNVARQVTTQYGRVPTAVIKEKVLAEQWLPVGNQRQFSFAVPPDAYPSGGDATNACTWRVVVRQPKRFRPDAITTVPIRVEPAQRG
jgi:hypothetical protein